MKTFVFDFDDKVHVYLLGVEVLYEIVSSLCSTTCCEQVVVYEYHIVLVDGVDVHLDGIDTIFFRE